jgi:hypothetical protein
MELEVWEDEKTGKYHFFRPGSKPEGLVLVGTIRVSFVAETGQYLRAMGDPQPDA